MFSCILVIYDATCSEFVKITFLKVVLIVPGISQSIKKDLNYQTLADKITECVRLILKIVFGDIWHFTSGCGKGEGDVFYIEYNPRKDTKNWWLAMAKSNYRLASGEF